MVGSVAARGFRANIMTTTAIVTVLCPDKTGLVSSITGLLWELGANLTDTSFAVLGSGADFSAICELPPGVEVSDIEQALAALGVNSFASDEPPSKKAKVEKLVDIQLQMRKAQKEVDKAFDKELIEASTKSVQNALFTILEAIRETSIS